MKKIRNSIILSIISLTEIILSIINNFQNKEKLLIIFGITFSFSFIYLIMKIKNKDFLHNKDKIIIYILSNIILITCIILGISLFTNEIKGESKDKLILDKSNIVTDNNIDLSKEKSDITINKKGTYTISGEFTHSIIIDAESEDVELVLNNVTINTENTATIIGLNANKITIKLVENTINSLSDGGSSSYDGCIFSNSDLVFEGNGTLIVNGNQSEGEGIATESKDITFNGGTYVITSLDDGINAGGDGGTITINDGTFYIDASGDGIDSNKDAIINGGVIFVMGSNISADSAIDTDDGYAINGGYVIALGNDMIELPITSSKQNTISFVLDTAISKDTVVALLKDDEVITSFMASKSYKTIIISSEKLQEGNYNLYVGGSNSGNLIYGIYQDGTYTKGDKITIDNTDTFKVNNIYGKERNDRR